MVEEGSISPSDNNGAEFLPTDAPQPEQEAAAPKPGELGDAEDLPNPEIEFSFPGGVDGSGHTFVGNIGNVTYGANRDEGKPYFLDLEGVERRKQTFVSPRNFDLAISENGRFKEKRLAVVYGPFRSGRLTCAFKLGEEFIPEDQRSSFRFKICKWQDNFDSDLRNAIKHKDWPSRSVVILENAFTKNFGPENLDESYLRELATQLNNEESHKNSFLILTTDLEVTKLAELATIKVGTSDLDMRTVLHRHLDHFQAESNLDKDLAAKVKRCWPKIRPLLVRPYQVLRFVEACLSRNQADLDVVELAQEACQIDRTRLRSWFEKLSTNEKLFALLAALFEGVDREDLNRIYCWSIALLNESQFPWVRDARLHGLLDIAELIRLEPDSAVSFEEPMIRNELTRQCANRHLLLWSLLEPAARILATEGVWIDNRLSWRLALALGKLGGADRRRFESAFTSWAQAKRGFLAGTALAKFAATEGGFASFDVIALLGRWLSSTEPRLVWAAGSACWQVYQEIEGLPEEVRRVLRANLLKQIEHLATRARDPLLINQRFKELKESRPDLSIQVLKVEAWRSLGNEILSCTAFALEGIWHDDPPAAEELYCDWLSREARWPHRQTALWAVANLVQRLGRLPPTFRDERFHRLLRLALGAADTGSREMAAILRSLLGWLKKSETDRVLVFSALLNVANLGGVATCEKLRNALAQFWLTREDQNDTEIERITKALIARSRLMNGVVLDYPELGSGVLALDPAFFSEAKTREHLPKIVAQGFAAHLAASIEARLDLEILKLGYTENLPLRPSLEATEQDEVTPSHRLLVPALEGHGVRKLRLIVILATAETIDLEDVVDAGWASDLLEIRVGEAGKENSMNGRHPLVWVNRKLYLKDLRQIETWLEERWAAALVTAPAFWWDQQLRSYGYDPDDPEAVATRIRAEVDQLEDFESFRKELDPARGAMAALLWRAIWDLESSLTWLANWLDKEEAEVLPGNATRQAMAAAVARALLGIHSAVVPHPQAEVAVQLFEKLANPLAKWHGEGIDALLSAVERWLADPEIRDYLSGDIIAGKGRFHRWAEKYLKEGNPEQKKILARLGPLLDCATAASANALAGAVDRLAYRLKAGAVVDLPPLIDGERFGLIVVDPEAGSEMADLACALAQHLTQEKACAIQPAIYRLGERQPALIDGFSHRWELKRNIQHPSPLLGGLLASLDPDSVAFVLILTGEPILDESDFFGTTWYTRLYSYRPQSVPGDRLFQVIPTFSPTYEARSIAAHLARRVSFRWRATEASAPPTN